MTKGSFEDYISTNGTQDVLQKAFDVHHHLETQDYPTERALGFSVLSPIGPYTDLCDKEGNRSRAIMLGTNSYLNLATHPKVVQAAHRALDEFGCGTGSSPLYTGATPLHKELEREISSFYGTEDAILISSGYGANIGIISALCSAGDVVVSDSANHASIFDGALLSGAELKICPHNNMKRLEHVLSRIPSEKKGRLIVTEGVFSMHGDLAPLDEVVQLAEKYGARLMVDDAHGIGIVGPTGRGTAELYGVRDRVDLNVGTLSKALAGLGGYCAGKKEVISYLRLYTRTYFFATALPAPLVAGSIEAFKLLAEDRAGREALWDNINYMKGSLGEMGFNLENSNSGIIPIIVGDEDKLALFHRDLFNSNVYTNLVSYPAVRRKECRLRLCVMSTLTREDMDNALSAIRQSGVGRGII